MKPEIQGKLMVAMVVSVLAFGFGTGTVLVAGHYQINNTPNTLNTTQPGDFPYLTNSQQTYIYNNTSSSGQSNKQNTNPTSHNNTTNP